MRSNHLDAKFVEWIYTLSINIQSSSNFTITTAHFQQELEARNLHHREESQETARTREGGAETKTEARSHAYRGLTHPSER